MTPQDYQKRATQLQMEFQEKIQKAAMAQNHNEITALVAELQEKMQTLAKEYSDAVTPQTQPQDSSPKTTEPVFQSKMTNMNLDQLAHPSDLAFFRELPRRELLNHILNDIYASGTMSRARRNLLSSAMRLTSNVSRTLFDVVESCRSSLDFKMPLELFVVHDHQFNAGVLPVSDGKVSIFLTSGLLESFNAAELAFVIGHELGHAVFGHINIPTEAIIRNFGHLISPKEMIGLRGWQRSAELSADRCGLLCAKDYVAACQAFFKLSSGITSSNYQFSVAEYMDQYSDLEKYIKESPADQIEEFYSTHPLNPIRLKALELFGRSQVYAQVAGKTPTGEILPSQQMEDEIQKFMALMEPTYLNDKSNIAATVREFIFLTGFMVARADGQIDPSEVKQLSQIIESADAESRVEAIVALPPQQVIEMIVTHSEKINFELPPVHRLNIIRDVFTIACADGQLTESELQEMAKICHVLQIKPSFLEELLRSLPSDEGSKQAA